MNTLPRFDWAPSNEHTSANPNWATLPYSDLPSFIETQATLEVRDWLRQEKNHYKSPFGYLPWAQFAAYAILEGCSGEPIRQSYESAEQHWMNQEAYVHSQLLFGSQPAAYFASEEITNAMRETPVSIASSDVLPLLPAFSIMMPRFKIKQSNLSGELYCACISIVDYRFFPNAGKKVYGTSEIITAVGHMESLGGGRARLCVPIGLHESSVKVGFKDAPISRIALGLLLGLAHQQVEITEETPAVGKAMGFGKSRGPQPLPCRWIGKHFKIQRESSPSRGGTHASPQAHWRRGHWHRVRHGQRKEQSKLLWYQPVFVNP